jgi:hypothetical protein
MMFFTASPSYISTSESNRMNPSLTRSSRERALPSGAAAWRRARSSLMAALLVSAMPSRASATPEYPAVIDASLQLPDPCPRPLSRCLICHTTARGGQRTAEQLFAITLRDYGLTRGNEGATLQNALGMLPEETDSDGDGESDKEELRGCGNPSGEELGIGPEYGCDGAHLARELPSDAPFVLIAVGVAGVLVRRRRRPAARA